MILVVWVSSNSMLLPKDYYLQTLLLQVYISSDNAHFMWADSAYYAFTYLIITNNNVTK